MNKSLANKNNAANSNAAGATMIEYALMAALIAVVCVAAVTFLGQQASTTFSGTASSIGAAIHSTN